MSESRGWVNLKVLSLVLIGIAPAEFNWFYNPRLLHSPLLFWTVDVARFVVLPMLLVWWGLAHGVFSLSDLGFHTRVFGRRNMLLFVAAVILIPLLMCWADRRIVDWAVMVLPPARDQPHFDYAQVLPPRGPETGLYRLLTVFYMALSTALTEELYFRGMFRRVFPRMWLWGLPFIVLSSAVFASVHWYGGPTKLLYAFAFGLLVAAIYALTGNLWPLITGHFLVDLGWLGSAS